MGLSGIISKRIYHKRILDKKAEEIRTVERVQRILEEDLARLVWELNFRLLLEQGLQENILWVDTAKVTEVSVRERKQSLFVNVRNLFRKLWKRGKTRNRNKSKKK